MKREPGQIPTLITGCSSGIGRATALRLVAAGFPVIATARDVSTLSELADAGCRTVALDVTDPDGIDQVVGEMESEFGAVGALVNNAGYSQSGAVESVSDAQARAQMDTNLFAPMALCRRALPKMREAGWGRIVQISSMGGRIHFPGGGWYHASKHALEAVSDSLRFEVAGFGVDVVLIEPGLITTGFADAVARELPESDSDHPYASFDAEVKRITTNAYADSFARRFGGGPETVAAAVEKALRASRPKTRVPVTASARILLFAHAVLSDRAWDRMAARGYPRPGA